MLRRTPHSQRHQPACKPGFVGHRLLAQTIRDGHSSGTTFARCLEQPTRTASLTSGVVCHAGSVAGPAVRSYRTFSPLLAPSLIPPPQAGEGRVGGKRFVLCGTVPGVAPAGRYPAPYVDGARTFLSSHLSVIAGAAVRPTDALGMGAPPHLMRWLPVRVKKTRQNKKIEPRFWSIRTGDPGPLRPSK